MLSTRALSLMGHVWQQAYTVRMNIEGLHAVVYVLKHPPQAVDYPSGEDGERGIVWQ